MTAHADEDINSMPPQRPAPSSSLHLRRQLAGRPFLDISVIKKKRSKGIIAFGDCDENKSKVAFEAAYELGTILGSGTTSVVRRARQRFGGPDLAVKCHTCLEEERLQFARDEYYLLRELRHPSIIRVVDKFEFCSSLFIVMELCPGGSISQRLEKFGVFEEVRAIALFFELLEGLNYLHEKRIVHRDIKPDNLMIQDEATALKITDFNSAKRIGRGPGSSLMLTDRGTHLYVAPELRFGRLWNERVDIWACGFCLFFMLKGVLPFDVMARGVAKSLLSGKLPEIKWDNISELTRNLISQCLTVNMRDRPPAMELLAHPSFDIVHPPFGCIGMWRDQSIGRDSVHSVGNVDYEFCPFADGFCDIFMLSQPCGLLAVRFSRCPDVPILPTQFERPTNECSSVSTNATCNNVFPPAATPESDASPHSGAGLPRRRSEGPSPLISPSFAKGGRWSGAPWQYQKDTCPFTSINSAEVLRRLARKKCKRDVNLEKATSPTSPLKAAMVEPGLRRCWTEVISNSGAEDSNTDSPCRVHF
eukprot:TRINITY_DN32965_c0_g1_i1.p1 TRINITY_DN32965_c0_g1~~TRINITY_DN32965_c0_g1_i1.p1  ORF type:complete len:561 (-),score=80.52 TRINITY_DN32965_c0_g1_i1:123-1721(-)